MSRSTEAMAAELTNLLAAQADRAGVRILATPGCLTVRGNVEASLMLARAMTYRHAEVDLKPCEVYH